MHGNQLRLDPSTNDLSSYVPDVTGACLELYIVCSGDTLLLLEDGSVAHKYQEGQELGPAFPSFSDFWDSYLEHLSGVNRPPGTEHFI
ncbi:MAG: hypothetical protein KDB14_00085 [Planctomycetales bacterium]|nr:hypothetical protein [Planctomycetales bacterium]